MLKHISIGFAGLLALSMPALALADASTTLSVSTSTGRAPLTVTFTSNAEASTTALYFGDGMVGRLGEHTYRFAGHYTALLVNDPACFHTWPRCATPITILATTSVSVSPRVMATTSATSTVQDLQQQIQALFQQVQQLMVQIKQLMTTIPARPQTAPPATGGIGGYARWCTSMKRLTKGSRGEDVSDLQRYLKDVGVFEEKNITGFFGDVTEAALKRFQSNEGVVSSGDGESTGFGRIGPRTLAAMKARCKPPATQSEWGKDSKTSKAPGPQGSRGEDDDEREDDTDSDRSGYGNGNEQRETYLQRCPDGTFGLYPVCYSKEVMQNGRGQGAHNDGEEGGAQGSPSCPTGMTGIYPNCTQVVTGCPTGTTGVYPACVSNTSQAPSLPSQLFATCVGGQLVYSWSASNASTTRYVLRIRDGAQENSPYVIATTTALTFSMNGLSGHQYFARMYVTSGDSIDLSSASSVESSPQFVICAAS